MVVKAGKIGLGTVWAILVLAMAGTIFAGEAETKRVDRTGTAAVEAAGGDLNQALVNEYKAIAEVVDTYIDGGRQGSGEIMKKAFHPGANVYGFVDGQLVGGPIQKLYDLVDSRPPTGDIPYKIVRLEAMEDVAMVRVDIDNWNGAKYCDMFTLVKANGQWKITSKVSYKF
jgi:hypothetical protein